jgi:acyl carrier protein
MQNEHKLRAAFVTSLGVDESRVVDSLVYNSIPEWDSVAHMVLVAELEKAFDVMLDTDDIIGMSSPVKAREILGKHGVSF